MQETANYGLEMPEGNEWADVEVLNRNADKIDVALTNKTDKPTILSLTIPTKGWTAAAIGQYSYSLTVEVEGITAQDIVNGSITLETESAAQDCNLATQCQSSDGAITFYAETVPTAGMVFEYYVLKGV